MAEPSRGPGASALTAVLPDVREDLIVCGKLLGTYEDWVQYDALDFVYYNFTPAEGVKAPAGDLGVNYETGELTIRPRTADGVSWSGKLLGQVVGVSPNGHKPSNHHTNEGAEK